jgi:hypothetical protein
MTTEPQGAGKLTCGTKTVAASATPEALVASSTPCRGVLLAGRTTQASGAAANANPVFWGSSLAQTMPILASDQKGVYIAIDDAAKIFLRALTNGDGVEYVIFS